MPAVKKITASETHLVTHLTLRKGKPNESCFYEEDNLESTQHFGLFSNWSWQALFHCIKKTMLFYWKKINIKSAEWLF